jgi:predicted DCC family thiol-disulfide oxidoreductase YuxK
MSSPVSLSARIAAAPADRFKGDAGVPAFDATRPLVVFDGVCVLCSRSMRFIATRDRAGVIQFTAAQSRLGQALYRHHGLDPETFETFLYIEEGRTYAKLDAAAMIARRLGGVWPLAGWTALRLPSRLRDMLYDAVATRRYRIFGRTEACFVPDASWRARVIE